MTKRKEIPAAIKSGVELLCGFRCCLCGVHGIQIHHLDGNPNNNDPMNLAALCLIHHDLAEQGKSTDGHTLSMKLSGRTIREAKRQTESAQSRRLGFASVDAFWKFHRKTPESVNLSGTYLGIAFKDWNGWRCLHDKIAAMGGDSDRRINFCLTLLEESLWVTATTRIPDGDNTPPKKWIKDDRHFVIPMDNSVSSKYALTTIPLLDENYINRSNNIVLEQLERADIFSKYGAYTEFVINGPQKWPSGDLPRELGVWLQYIGILHSYFDMLGDSALQWRILAEETSRLRAANMPLRDWKIPCWDGIVAEKIDILVTLIRGKAEYLADHIAAPTEDRFSKSFRKIIEEFTVPNGAISRADLVDVFKVLIAKLVEPSNLVAVLNYPNHVLHQRDIQSFQDGKFRQHLMVTTADLTNTKPKYVEPSSAEGRCNLKIDLNDYYSIKVHPEVRPSSTQDWESEWKSINVIDLFKLVREGVKGVEVPFPR